MHAWCTARLRWCSTVRKRRLSPSLSPQPLPSPPPPLSRALSLSYKTPRRGQLVQRERKRRLEAEEREQSLLLRLSRALESQAETERRAEQLQQIAAVAAATGERGREGESRGKSPPPRASRGVSPSNVRPPPAPPACPPPTPAAEAAPEDVGAGGVTFVCPQPRTHICVHQPTHSRQEAPGTGNAVGAAGAAAGADAAGWQRAPTHNSLVVAERGVREEGRAGGEDAKQGGALGRSSGGVREKSSQSTTSAGSSRSPADSEPGSAAAGGKTRGKQQHLTAGPAAWACLRFAPQDAGTGKSWDKRDAIIGGVPDPPGRACKYTRIRVSKSSSRCRACARTRATRALTGRGGRGEGGSSSSNAARPPAPRSPFAPASSTARLYPDTLPPTCRERQGSSRQTLGEELLFA